MKRRKAVLAAIGPTRAGACGAAVLLAPRVEESLVPFSLAGYLARPRAPARIVLCPSGRSLPADIDFLQEASQRLLWGAPDPVLAGAIEGLLGSLPDKTPRLARGRGVAAGRAGPVPAALLLEGPVSSARALSVASGDARYWIVESPRHVRVERRLMDRLRRIGVRWSALEPITVAAVLAFPRLARARSRWRSLFPAGTPIWLRRPPPTGGRA